MNNTEKKLDALIDALGFDVEKVVTTVHPPHFTDMYIEQGPVHTVNYKFTKRDAPVVDDSIKVSDWIGQGPANKPPLGIPPKTIHDGLREEEIISAMIRYLKDRKAIPDSWRTELDTLQAARS
jgi:hypothetical protein